MANGVWLKDLDFIDFEVQLSGIQGIIEYMDAR